MQPIDILIHDLAFAMREIRDFGAQITEERAAELFLSTAYNNHCPRCAAPDCQANNLREVKCATCGKSHSLTASSPLAGTKMPLSHWLAAIWHIFVDDRTISARGFGRKYVVDKMTAWRLLRKIRQALPYFTLEDGCGIKGQVLGKESKSNHAEVCVAQIGAEIRFLDGCDAPKIETSGAKANSLFYGRLKAWLTCNFHGVSKRYLWLYLAEYAHRYNRGRLLA